MQLKNGIKTINQSGNVVWFFQCNKLPEGFRRSDYHKHHEYRDGKWVSAGLNRDPLKGFANPPYSQRTLLAVLAKANKIFEETYFNESIFQVNEDWMLVGAL